MDDAAPTESLLPSGRRPSSAALPDLSGSVISDRYHVLGLIGEGGFGLVYEAEQVRPMRRRVALKVLKPGMDSRSVLARFEAERQALAVMDHPNIARVLDGGATDAGHPYFVMELVRGAPITTFCDTHRLTIRERVALFRAVCEAVQHAHSKGVIHRDLKPSNILVEYEGGKPAPKVIDFGVAKAIDQRLSEHTIFTERGQLIGTPEYTSPEQAEMSGLDIDTRTDVYSLGVVLYELLTGVTPFDPTTLRKAAFNEIQRIIREVDPPKPSTRLELLRSTGSIPDLLSRIATSRRLREPELRSALARDLDWIVLKSIEKDRDRRYATPLALAEDLQHFLDDEPVDAGPPSTTYRIRKFIKRNRGGVIAASVIVGALVLGIVGTTSGLAWALREQSRANAEASRASEAARVAEDQRRIADEQRDRAEQAGADAIARAKEAEQAASVLVKLFGSIDPGNERQRRLTVTELLTSLDSDLKELFSSDSLAAAYAVSALGSAYLRVGDADRAAADLSDALERLSRHEDAPVTSVVYVKTELANASSVLDRTADALRYARDAVRLAQSDAIPMRARIDATTRLAWILSQTGDPGDAAETDALFLEVARLECLLMPTYAQDAGPEPAALAQDIGEGRCERHECYARFVSIVRRVWGDRNGATVFWQIQWAHALADAGELDEAVRISEAAVQIIFSTTAELSAERAWRLRESAVILRKAGNFSLAADRYGASADILSQIWTPADPRAETVRATQISALIAADRSAEALPLAQAKLARSRLNPTLPARHLDSSIAQLAKIAFDVGEYEESASLWDELIERSASQGQRSRYRHGNFMSAVTAHARAGHPDIALDRAARDYTEVVEAFGADDARAWEAADAAAKSCDDLGQPDESARWRSRARASGSDADTVIVDPARPAEAVGKQAACEGVIQATKDIGSKTFLNFFENFRGKLALEIPASACDKWPTPPVELFKDKRIRATGMVYERAGTYYITILEPAQIEILDAAEPDPGP